MGIFGHIMKFVLIILVAVLVVVIIACGAMFLFPSFKLFGYHYINSGTSNNAYEYLRGPDSKDKTAWDEADIIRIDSCGYDIKFEYAKSSDLMDDGAIEIRKSGVYRGFVKGSVENIKYTSTNSTYKGTAEQPAEHSYLVDETRPDKKIYFIKIQEPESGFMLRSENLLLFKLTYDAFANKDVEIITKSGAVYFGAKDDVLSCKNLNIESESGSVYLNNMKINTHYEGSQEKLGNIIIKKSQKGKVVANTNLKANVSIEVNGGSDEIQLKNIEGIPGEGEKDRCEVFVKNHTGTVTIGNIDGDLNTDCYGARMFVGKVLGTVKLKVKETNTQISQIGDTEQTDTCVITAKGKTTINIGKMYCKLNVNENSNTGITIDEMYGDVLGYKGDKGSLTLNKVHASTVNILETNGKINIHAIKDDVVNINSYATSGTISFDGIGLGRVVINETNENSTCNIYGDFEKVTGQNIFNTTKGEIKIRAIKDSSYTLGWHSKTADINIFGNQKTTKWSSEEYCKSKDQPGLKHTTAFGEPCGKGYNNLELNSSGGKVVVSEL